MDGTAITAIRQLAVEAARENRIGGVGKSETPAVIIGNTIHSLEYLQPGRSRFRGIFETSVLSEFAAYVKANPGGHGFIGAKNFTATVFHNLGDKDNPGHGDWRSTLTLEPTAAYAAMITIEGARLTQKQLVEWIEDWNQELEAKFGERAAVSDIAGALNAIRNLTISAKSDVTHTDKDFGAGRSAIEEIEAKAQGGIPSHLVFTCDPYPGFKEWNFSLRLSVITGDKPALTLRIVSKEAIAEEIATEFKEKLLEEIGDAATMTIGSFEPETRYRG